MNQTGNPEMMDLMEAWGKEGAADDREVTEMFRGKTNISNTEEKQVRSFWCVSKKCVQAQYIDTHQSPKPMLTPLSRPSNLKEI